MKFLEALRRSFSEDFAAGFSAHLCVSGLPDQRPDLLQRICSDSNRPVPRFTLFSLIIFSFSLLLLQCGTEELHATEGSCCRRREVKTQVSFGSTVFAAIPLRFVFFHAVKLFELLNLFKSLTARTNKRGTFDFGGN